MCVVFFHLADVMRAVGLYELSVLGAGWGAVVTGQSRHIPAEFIAEGRRARHAVTKDRKTAKFTVWQAGLGRQMCLNQSQAEQRVTLSKTVLGKGSLLSGGLRLKKNK